MPAAIAEHRDEEIGTAVDHFRLLAEFRRGVDHAQELDDALDAIEVAQFGLHDGDQAQAGLAGVLVALLLREVATDLADRQRMAGQTGALAGEIEQVAGAHGVDVIGHRRGRLGELDAEFLQPLFGLHAVPLQSAFTRSRKARINSTDFTPRLDSTPEETSTVRAPVTRTASATLSGVRPPARSHGSGTVRPDRMFQSKAVALP